MRQSFTACLLIAFSCNGPAQEASPTGNTVRILGTSASDAQVTTGLRETLLLTTTKAIQRAAAENGFWGNEGIKISLPEPLMSSEKGLRLMGQGLKIDELQLLMNRVAESASPSAGEVFGRAIAATNYSDPRAILNGGSMAAAEDLRRSSFSAMVKALRPAVVMVISKTDAQQQFNELANQYTGLTLGGKCQVDLADYLAGKIVAGLLNVSAQEEASLRVNPEGGSDLLKKLFSTT